MAVSQGNNAESNMVSGVIAPETIDQAKEDAKVFLDVSYGVKDDDNVYSIALRYYTCHLLYMWGFALTTVNSSVDDVSVTKQSIELSEKEGNSPYIHEFRKLIDEDIIQLSV